MSRSKQSYPKGFKSCGFITHHQGRMSNIKVRNNPCVSHASNSFFILFLAFEDIVNMKVWRSSCNNVTLPPTSTKKNRFTLKIYFFFFGLSFGRAKQKKEWKIILPYYCPSTSRLIVLDSKTYPKFNPKSTEYLHLKLRNLNFSFFSYTYVLHLTIIISIF